MVGQTIWSGFTIFRKWHQRFWVRWTIWNTLWCLGRTLKNV